MNYCDLCGERKAVSKEQRELKWVAIQVVEIMAASLSQFSKAERKRRIKVIHRISLSAGRRV